MLLSTETLAMTLSSHDKTCKYIDVFPGYDVTVAVRNKVMYALMIISVTEPYGWINADCYILN
jgi:hypothetical protein